MAECDPDSSFIVANTGGNALVHLSTAGDHDGVYGKLGSGNGEFNAPTALAMLPTGGLVVLESCGDRLQLFG